MILISALLILMIIGALSIGDPTGEPQGAHIFGSLIGLALLFGLVAYLNPSGITARDP